MERMLEIQGVSKFFGGLCAIDRLSLEVRRGEICGLIGPNGAGKTTLFNLITGVYPPNGGQIQAAGVSLRGLPPHRITALGIARTFQKIRLFANLTVAQNIQLGQHCRTTYGLFRAVCGGAAVRRENRRIRETTRELLAFFHLDPRREEPAKNLSYGEQRRVEIARAMATEPKLLLLDEPACGLNPKETEELMETIRRIRERGVTVFFIEHNMDLTLNITDHLVVLDYGKKIFDDQPQKVRSCESVVKAYLGEDYTAPCSS